MADIIAGKQYVEAAVILKNISSYPMSSRIRVDIKPSELPYRIPTWVEGNWLSFSLSGGEQKTLYPQSVTVPGDWEEGTTVYTKIQIEGIEGPSWDNSDGSRPEYGRYLFTVKKLPAVLVDIVGVTLVAKG